MLTYLRKHTKIVMIIVAFVFVASMFYGVGYTGLQQFSSNKNKSFLKVNGKEVDLMRFNSIFTRLRQSFPESLSPQDILFLQNMALSQTIDFSIMLDDAKRHERISGGELDSAIEGVAKQEKFANVAEFKTAVERSGLSWSKFRKMIKDEMLVQKMISKIKNSVQVSKNDLREVRASHILITIKPEPNGENNAKKKSEEIKKEIDKGTDFSALAKKYSSDPGTKDKGGDLGFFGTGKMVKPFEDAAFSMKIGEVSGPVKTDYGYHIIKVTDSRMKKSTGGKDIESSMLQEKQEQAFNEWFYKLKKNAKVEILDPNLRALDLRFKGKVSDAIVEYQKAIKETPGNAFLRLFLGILYEDTNNMKEAISQYVEAVKLEPADPTMYLTLGKAYLKTGQKDLAVAQFKKASLIAGDNKDLHKELEKTFKQLGLSSLQSKERSEVLRIEKKEAFERELKDRQTKVKTEF